MTLSDPEARDILWRLRTMREQREMIRRLEAQLEDILRNSSGASTRVEEMIKLLDQLRQENERLAKSIEQERDRNADLLKACEDKVAEESRKKLKWGLWGGVIGIVLGLLVGASIGG